MYYILPYCYPILFSTYSSPGTFTSVMSHHGLFHHASVSHSQPFSRTWNYYKLNEISRNPLIDEINSSRQHRLPTNLVDTLTYCTLSTLLYHTTTIPWTKIIPRLETGALDRTWSLLNAGDLVVSRTTRSLYNITTKEHNEGNRTERRKTHYFEK